MHLGGQDGDQGIHTNSAQSTPPVCFCQRRAVVALERYHHRDAG